MHLVHITPVVKLLDDIIQLNGANHPQISTRSFGGSIHILHVPQQWWGDKPWTKIYFKIFKIFLNDEEGGVGGLNPIPHLVKPLITMPLSFEFFVISMMNPKP
jgi:hypothetical protein